MGNDRDRRNDDKLFGFVEGFIYAVVVAIAFWTVVGLVVLAWWKWLR